MNDLVVWTRYTAPTKLDEAPFGTLWLQVIESFNEDIKATYIQTSRDEKQPIWEKIGIFLERVFKNKILDPIFIEEALRIYEENK